MKAVDAGNNTPVSDGAPTNCTRAGRSTASRSRPHYDLHPLTVIRELYSRGVLDRRRNSGNAHGSSLLSRSLVTKLKQAYSRP